MDKLPRTEKKASRLVDRFEQKEGMLRKKIGQGQLMADEKIRTKIGEKRSKLVERLGKLKEKGPIGEYNLQYIKREEEGTPINQTRPKVNAMETIRKRPI
jgi:hypothetical protein